MINWQRADILGAFGGLLVGGGTVGVGGDGKVIGDAEGEHSALEAEEAAEGDQKGLVIAVEADLLDELVEGVGVGCGGQLLDFHFFETMTNTSLSLFGLGHASQ